MSQKLSDLIGWNCIQRRNFGLVWAWQAGAEVIAMVDDDNIPYDRWGQTVLVGRDTDAVLFKTNQLVLDPLAVTHPGTIWHRGFPVQLLDGRQAIKSGLVKRRVLVQADLWDGDPDVDAICRIAQKPTVRFNPHMIPFTGNKPMPFNSQNTFISRDILPEYFLFPHIGRMDDIWAAYVTQAKYPDSVIFARASVRQDRNEHDLVKDLKAELLGYTHTLEFVEWLADSVEGTPWPSFMPAESLRAYEAYRELLQ